MLVRIVIKWITHILTVRIQHGIAMQELKKFLAKLNRHLPYDIAFALSQRNKNYVTQKSVH